MPRHIYDGANGPVKVVTLVHYAEQNWTEVDPVAVFSTRKTVRLKSFVSRAKFDAFTGQTGLKIVGVRGSIQFEDRAKRKAAPELKALDNVWICGTLQPAEDGHGQQLLIYDIMKLPPDAQRFENRFQTLEHAANAQGLIDLGQGIDRTVRNNKTEGLIGYERLIALRDKAWNTAIQIKEKELRPRDANGCYEIATMYRDLLHRSSQYRAWVLKTLDIDPDHVNDGKDAEKIMLQALRRRRRSLDDCRRIGQDRKECSKNRRLKCRTRKQKLERKNAAQREKEIANRAAFLLDYQSALRTNDAAARVGALSSLGDAIKTSLDLGFGLSAVDILANLNGDAAIINGLDRAAKSDFIEIRQHVYATLVWRASLSDGSAAYDVLAGALRTEKAKEAAQTASDALAQTGGKAAIAKAI